VAVGFECGGSDYVIKPFQESEILARVETHLRLYAHHVRLESLVQAKIVEIADTQMSVIFALAKLADSRDEQTGQHLERVQTYCGVLGARLLEIAPASAGITEATIQTVCLASVLHDIGKVGVPDEILLNRGKLTPQEFDRMKSHTLIGATTLESVLDRHPRNRFIETGIEIARSHHERWDGGGYPDGLKGGDIPLSARIVAVADVYDALRSRRTYKDSCSHERSVDLIVAGAGNHFDPLLVEAFKQCEQSLNAAFEAPLQPRPPSWRN
jgi:putative two-component system response regulator